jgi:hypothetical protein
MVEWGPLQGGLWGVQRNGRLIVIGRRVVIRAVWNMLVWMGQ